MSAIRIRADCCSISGSRGDRNVRTRYGHTSGFMGCLYTIEVEGDVSTLACRVDCSTDR